jgi:ubiquinone/menaquinone biosynthesis C-methylase UbiE
MCVGVGEVTRTLGFDAVRRFYDRVGSLQDTQAFYEDPALDVLCRHAALGVAHDVFELGCGTGRLAERLLARELPASARYVGLDLSPTMVALSVRRLSRFGDRAAVVLGTGAARLPGADATFDRVVSTFVLDLMDESGISDTLSEARRLLRDRGRLCLVSLTHGTGLASRLLSRGWSLLHRLDPVLVGGCRPISLLSRLEPTRWRVLHHSVVVAWTVPSEVVVAERS